MSTNYTGSSPPKSEENGSSRQLGERSPASPSLKHKKKKKIAARGMVKPANNLISTGKKRKRSSPFRIKVGCVVALRFRTEGNNVYLSTGTPIAVGKTEDNTSLTPMPALQPQSIDLFRDGSYVQAWASPVAGRDEGLALIGKRVRCFFPKLQQQEGTEDNRNKISDRRVLEGEIISLPDYGKSKRSNRGGDPRPTKVELLVNKAHLNEIPFTLRRAEDDANNTIDPTTLSGKAKRHYELEASIRGGNKATVKIKLGHIATMDSTAAAANTIRWAILKCTPNKLFHQRNNNTSSSSHKEKGGFEQNNGKGDKGDGNDNNGEKLLSLGPPKKRRKFSAAGNNKNILTTSTKYVGDGNDSDQQQIANWRWLVGRYHDLMLSSSNHNNSISLPPSSYAAEILSGGFLGQVISMDPSASSTLAMVTLRRLLLPEHSATGRRPYHGLFSIFHDHDNFSHNKDAKNGSAPDEQNHRSTYVIQVPIEQLIIVSRKLREVAVDSSDNGCLEGDSNVEQLVVSHSYSLCRDKYIATSEAGKIDKLDVDISGKEKADDSFTNGTRLHDKVRNAAMEVSLKDEKPPEKAPFVSGSVVARAMDPIDFSLPLNFIDISDLPIPTNKPNTRLKPRTPTKAKRHSPLKNPKKGSGQRSPTRMNAKENVSQKNRPLIQTEDYSVFKPTCARLLAYEPARKTESPPNETNPTGASDKPRNLREMVVSQLLTGVDKDNKITSSRKARAAQRRFMKDAAAFGGADNVASREPRLRFNRSGIHAWGVFADENIAAEEMIIEYRGELIGNAVAEVREKEYEAAKIGSDYMFRIDSLNVCDATKQGCVARFINASCDPNCYTKIIAIGGDSRIVIYSKKDIAAGEELCYDYKFPIEYDESKRIPCHCGARECRGFMNWVCPVDFNTSIRQALR